MQAKVCMMWMNNTAIDLSRAVFHYWKLLLNLTCIAAKKLLLM
jgi:hypothetical protein